jgi:hypothetical protein
MKAIAIPPVKVHSNFPRKIALNGESVVFDYFSEETSNHLRRETSMILGIIVLIVLTNISIYRHVSPMLSYTATTATTATTTTTTTTTTTIG